MPNVEKPSLDKLIVRDAFYFALQQNRMILKFYKGGMSEEEFTQLNKLKLNNIIQRMDKFYGFHFRDKGWLFVAIRAFLSDLDFPYNQQGYGLIVESRDMTIVNWRKEVDRNIL